MVLGSREPHCSAGAITYDFMVPGDSPTPGWASVSGAKANSFERGRVGAEDHGPAAFNGKMQASAGKYRVQSHLPRARPVCDRYHLGGQRRPRFILNFKWTTRSSPITVVRIAEYRTARIARRLGGSRQSSRCMGIRRSRSSSGTASMMEHDARL